MIDEDDSFRLSNNAPARGNQQKKRWTQISLKREDPNQSLVRLDAISRTQPASSSTLNTSFRQFLCPSLHPFFSRRRLVSLAAIHQIPLPTYSATFAEAFRIPRIASGARDKPGIAPESAKFHKIALSGSSSGTSLLVIQDPVRDTALTSIPWPTLDPVPDSKPGPDMTLEPGPHSGRQSDPTTPRSHLPTGFQESLSQTLHASPWDTGE